MNLPDDVPAPVAALFPGREIRERLDNWMTRELASANERIAHG